MAKLVLHPFPRLPEGGVKWVRWAAKVDERVVDIAEVADNWDANSRLAFFLSVAVSHDDLLALGDPAQARLVVNAVCHATAMSWSEELPLAQTQSQATARCEISLSGRDVSGRIDLAAAVVVPIEHAGWLARRVVAEAEPVKVPLEHEREGFPVTVLSFDEEGWHSAPWRFDVFATDLEDTFAQSIRLYINEDYPQAVELLEGTGSTVAKALLEASIVRQLVASASALESDTVSADQVAEEFPESFAAAARQAASRIFQEPLADVCRRYRDRPESFELRLMHETGLMRGEA